MRKTLVSFIDRSIAPVYGRIRGSRIKTKICGKWGIITLGVLIIALSPTEVASGVAWISGQIGIETSVLTTTNSVRLLQLVAAAEFITRIVVGTALSLEVAAREPFAAKLLDRIGSLVEMSGPFYRIIATYVAASFGFSPVLIAYMSILGFVIVYCAGIVVLLFQSDLERGRLAFITYFSKFH